MFTVRWIADNGAEMLYDAKDVSFTPGSGGNSAPEVKAVVSFYSDGVHTRIDEGRVYVMNGAGRTVSDYILSTKEFPHGLMPRQAA